MRPRVPNAPRNWPLRRLAGKAPSCRPTGSIVCRFEVRDFAPGRAGADPAPRGAGPEAGDGSAAQTCSSAHPAEAGIGFGGVLCFQKAKYWDQLPSLSSESKREDATARFLCRGFPYESSRGIPCSAYTGTYPIPGFKAPALRLPTPSGRNLKNSAQNLVRMEPGKIATHYIQRVRRKKEKTLGPATKPKHEALNELAEYIAEQTGKLAKQGESISTFAELWKAFCAVKSGQWSKKTKENLQCLFAKHIIPQIGSQRMRDVTLTPLQLLLNKLAEDGFSKSVVGQIRTLKSCFEYAVDEDLISKSP